MTLFTGKAKKYGHEIDMRGVLMRPDEKGDTRITGIAVMLAMIELTVPTIAYFMTRHYQFACFSLIQLLITLLLFYDIFVGLLLACYTSIVQAAVFAVLLLGELTDWDHTTIRAIFPFGENVDLHVYLAVATWIVVWSVTRLVCSRRAMYHMYVSRVCARKICDVGIVKK